MAHDNNKNREFLPLDIAILTVSDTRTEANDTSGGLLRDRLTVAGHRLADKQIDPDDVYRIRATVAAWIASPAVQVVITTGGTGFHVFYKDTLVKDGTILPLYYHSPWGTDGKPVKSEDYPKGVENFVDFVENTLGKKLIGPQYEAYQWICTYATLSQSIAAPNGIDKNVLTQLRKAHKETTEDPEFKAAYVKQFATWPIWGSGENYEKIARSYTKLSTEALDVLKKMTASKKK